jgi:hypothetical protein
MSTLEQLRGFDLVYLGTPYSKYPGGIEVAFEHACVFAANLLRHQVKVYSPIAHTHPIAIHGKIDPLDLNIWLPFDAAMMAKADAMVVGLMPGWEESRGVAHEIEVFKTAGKPVFYLSPSEAEI